MSNIPASRDLARTTLGVLFIGMLIAGTFWVMKPFLPPLIWATMIVVATWPMMVVLQSRLGGRRWIAVTLMSVALLLVLIVPLALAISTIVDHSDDIVSLTQWLGTFSLPPPPEWLRKIPIVGSRLASEWQQLASGGPGGIVARVTPYVGNIARWLASQAGNIGLLFVHFLLTVVIAAILYAGGESAGTSVRRFFHRLSGHRGDHAVQLAAKAVRAVALGVIVTALAQSTLGGIGLAIAGIPYAALLTAVMFMLCIAQLGPGLVLVPAVVWLYWSGDNVWGTFLLVWTLIVGSMDNFLRPILIKKGADLPLLLIFAGVIGGLFAFGIIGLFIGPVILAVSYTLVSAWIEDDDRLELEPSSGAGEPPADTREPAPAEAKGSASLPG
jgi:predicted PurR-regulated permease PerM